jgi:hypothetical protein
MRRPKLGEVKDHFVDINKMVGFGEVFRINPRSLDGWPGVVGAFGLCGLSGFSLTRLYCGAVGGIGAGGSAGFWGGAPNC